MNPINQSAAGSPLGERAARRMPHRPCAAFGTVVKRHRACAAYGWTGAAALLLVVLLLGSVWQVATAAEAENPLESTTSDTARDSALRSIPFEKLSELDKAKVRSVLANVSLFRRLPVRMIDCDPDLYLFLMRHPDVLANIWETLGISQLQVRQGSAAGTFRVSDKAGTQGAAQIIYQDSDTHLIYGDGAYQGVLAVTPARGRCLLILKSGYVHETDGRHYIISRLDAFVNIESGPAELLTKAFEPLVGKVADTNFIQTLAFLGSMSHTAEVNYRGVVRLSNRLQHVEPQYREQLAALAERIAKDSRQATARPAQPTPLPIARRESDVQRN